MNRQSCWRWRCVLEIEYRPYFNPYNNIRIAYSLILRSTRYYTPCSVRSTRTEYTVLHSTVEFDGDVRAAVVPWMVSYQPPCIILCITCIKLSLQSPKSLWIHRSYMKSLIWCIDIMILDENIFYSVHFVWLCTLYSVHYPTHIRILKWGWCSVFMQVGTRPSANSAHQT